MRRSIQKIVSKFSNLGGQYKKFYFAQFAFFLSLSLLCIALNAMGTLWQGDYLVFCFFIIATIGISHGSLDGKKGEYILKKKFSIYWSIIFYGTYIFLALLALWAWLSFPIVSICIFFIVAAFHFGSEDLEMFFKTNSKIKIALYFFRGLLVISAPFYLNNLETVNFVKIVLMEQNWPTLDAYFYYNVFYINLFFLAILIFFFHIKKDISFLDSLIILAEIVSTIAIFKYLPLIVAFTIYFCFMHSTKHILSSSMEINRKKLADGIKKFIKMSLPLTVITFAIAVIMLFYLNIDLTIEKSILRTVFIGLASLTLPHIMLEYIYGTYKKKS